MFYVKVVVGIIQRDGKVLVAERPADKPYAGYWEFPGGKIEENEAGKHALTRELHEELGIDITSANQWFTHDHHYPDKSVHLEIWLVDQFSGEPHPKENQQLRWVNYDEMMSLRLLEGNWPIMTKLKELF
jgi:8-oxo-dGTP diphosphatase